MIGNELPVAWLRLTSTTLASLDDLALALERGLFVKAATLHFLQDALFGHLLLEYFKGLLEAIANLNFDRLSKGIHSEYFVFDVFFNVNA